MRYEKDVIVNGITVAIRAASDDGHRWTWKYTAANGAGGQNPPDAMLTLNAAIKQAKEAAVAGVTRGQLPA